MLISEIEYLLYHALRISKTTSTVFWSCCENRTDDFYNHKQLFDHIVRMEHKHLVHPHIIKHGYVTQTYKNQEKYGFDSIKSPEQTRLQYCQGNTKATHTALEQQLRLQTLILTASEDQCLHPSSAS